MVCSEQQGVDLISASTADVPVRETCHYLDSSRVVSRDGACAQASSRRPLSVFTFEKALCLISFFSEAMADRYANMEEDGDAEAVEGVHV